jgi:hypothetical protein
LAIACRDTAASIAEISDPPAAGAAHADAASRSAAERRWSRVGSATAAGPEGIIVELAERIG